MPCHRVCNLSNTASVTCGAGTDYPSRDTIGATCGAGTDYRPETQHVPHVGQELIISPETQQVSHVGQELIIHLEIQQVRHGEQELIIRSEYPRLPSPPHHIRLVFCSMLHWSLVEPLDIALHVPAIDYPFGIFKLLFSDWNDQI